LNISTVELLDWLVKASYLVAATLFLLGCSAWPRR